MSLRILLSLLVGLAALGADGGSLWLQAPAAPVSSHPPWREVGNSGDVGTRFRSSGGRPSLTALARAYIEAPGETALAVRMLASAREVGRNDWLRSFAAASARRLPTASTTLMLAELEYAERGYAAGIRLARVAYLASPDDPEIRVSYAAALAGVGRVLEAYSMLAPVVAEPTSWGTLSDASLQRLAVIGTAVAPESLGDRLTTLWLRQTWRSGAASARARALAFAAVTAESVGNPTGAVALANESLAQASRSTVPASSALAVMTSAEIDAAGEGLVGRFESVCQLLPDASRAAPTDCLVSALERAVQTGSFIAAVETYALISREPVDNPLLSMRIAAAAIPLLEVLGAYRETVKVASQAVDGSARVGDIVLRGTFLVRLARALRLVGDYPGAHAVAEQAEETSTGTDLVGDRARVEVAAARRASLGMEALPSETSSQGRLGAVSEGGGKEAATGTLADRHEGAGPGAVFATVRHANELEALGRSDDALHDYLRAMEMLSAFRHGGPSDLLQSAMLGDAWQAVNRRALTLALERGDVELGLAILEAGRSLFDSSGQRVVNVVKLDLPDRTALVAYAVGLRRVWAIIARGGETVLVETPERPTVLRDRVTLWRELAKTNTDPRRWERLGESLASSLFASIQATGLLADVDLLYVVPDDVLHLVPFASLLRPPATGIGNSYVVAQAPSIESLQRARARMPRAGPLVAFGVGGGSATIDEMRAIRDAGGRVFLGDRATESEWKRQSARASAIHFGGHSTPRTASSGAALRLTGASGTDGVLTLAEILSVRLSGSTVVLLGCDTATRSEEPGAAMFYRQTPSLGEAFLYSGARAVVGNLWPITEEDAKLLAVEFYRAGGPEGGVAALARALAILRQEFPDMPRRWAGSVWLGAASPPASTGDATSIEQRRSP